MNLFPKYNSSCIQKKILLVVFLCLLFNISLSAHGDLDLQIERISKRIEKNPGDANLYLKRGQLYNQHKEPEKSKQDYLLARNLDDHLLITDLLLAQMFADNNEANAALPYVNLFLKNHPNHSIALITRAKIYQQMRQPDLCQKDLENALNHIVEPNPSHFISIAEAVLLTDDSNISEALDWLKKGEEKFGFDIVLKSKEVDLYVQNKQHENAILTIDKIMEHFQRKEKWLFQKAIIYEDAGEMDLAKNHYVATLEAINKLPKRMQMTSKIIELEVHSLKRINGLSE
ncbi:MAG: tetratricopeptide repeat protein [Saprospiraceae bacterium]